MLTAMETTRGDTLTTMAVPWNGLTKLWASHGIRHHTACGYRGDGHTRGYAYGDGDYARIGLRRCGDRLTAMAVPWNGLTKLWASHGIGHHTALGITRHVDTGWTDIHADTLTTIATTRG